MTIIFTTYTHYQEESNLITPEQMSAVLLEMYAGLPNPQCHVDMMVSWMLQALDKCVFFFLKKEKLFFLCL